MSRVTSSSGQQQLVWNVVTSLSNNYWQHHISNIYIS